MLKREYCYSLRLQRSHSTNATIIRDGCSRSLAQLRRKAYAKLKKNSINLKCKLLQIFPTVVDKLLCPHGQIVGWNGRAICIPSNTVVRLKHSFWDENVFILCCFVFFHGGGYLVFSPLFLNYTERAVAETVSTPPTLSSRDTWIYTWGNRDEIKCIYSFQRQRFPQVPAVFLTCQQEGKQAFIQTNVCANIYVKTPPPVTSTRTKPKVDTPHFLRRTFGICEIIPVYTTIFK